MRSRPDWLSSVWLALGLGLMVFGTARWSIPLAAWLYPVFLLRFVRTQPAWRGLALVVLASTVVLGFAWRDFFGPYFPTPLVVLIVVLFAALHALPYMADRALVRRLGGVSGTFVFPLATTGWWYLFALVSPWGTTFNPAHTQYGNLPLLQLLSVTGVWGVDFLMAWLAAVVNWAWEREFAWRRVRSVSLAYAGLLGLVLLFGGARLTLFPAQASTVRIAGISQSPALLETVAERQAELGLDPHAFNAEIVAGTTTPRDRALLRQAWAPIVDDLLARTEQEARAGARIVVWPECGVQGLQEDEATLIERVAAVARATGAYVNVGACQLLPAPIGRWVARDESILVGPAGDVLWRFEKARPVAGVEVTTVPGHDRLVPVETPYGRLAGVVCYDANFPAVLAPAARAGLDILLVAANDWREWDPLATQIATARAIEHGYSLVRQSSHGLAMTVDYQGNVLAAADYFTSDPQVMVASVPTRGVRTVYTMVGDLFAWLSLAGLVALAGVAVARRGA